VIYEEDVELRALREVTLVTHASSILLLIYRVAADVSPQSKAWT